MKTYMERINLMLMFDDDIGSALRKAYDYERGRGHGKEDKS